MATRTGTLSRQATGIERQLRQTDKTFYFFAAAFLLAAQRAFIIWESFLLPAGVRPPFFLRFLPELVREALVCVPPNNELNWASSSWICFRSASAFSSFCKERSISDMPYTARGLGSKMNLQGIIANTELQLALPLRLMSASKYRLAWNGAPTVRLHASLQTSPLCNRWFGLRRSGRTRKRLATATGIERQLRIWPLTSDLWSLNHAA